MGREDPINETEEPVGEPNETKEELSDEEDSDRMLLKFGRKGVGYFKFTASKTIHILMISIAAIIITTIFVLGSIMVKKEEIRKRSGEREYDWKHNEDEEFSESPVTEEYED